MTDLNERLAAMLDGEPTAPYDLDRVVAGGRRALRRRTALTAVAGTAGTAAITAAVVVPIAMNDNPGSGDQITVATQPTPKPHCKLYYELVPAKNEKVAIRKLHQAHPDLAEIKGGKITNGKQYLSFTTCPPGAVKPGDSGYVSDPAPAPTSTLPPYHYNADPRTIADGFGAQLNKQVKALGFSIIYTRPFAQESSTLEKGHPSYFDGGVDVELPDGPANITVQVTHDVMELVPYDGDCNAPTCTRSTLPDGSLVQFSDIDAGSGGAQVIAVEIHRVDGVVVSAQEANYAFGPEATRARSTQPLTIEQLTALAENAAWTF